MLIFCFLEMFSGQKIAGHQHCLLSGWRERDNTSEPFVPKHFLPFLAFKYASDLPAAGHPNLSHALTLDLGQDHSAVLLKFHKDFFFS